jgi:multiple inositol-polyphosphate phosphatase/2,3-bisphosphoglycerate 3-phosphatase
MQVSSVIRHGTRNPSKGDVNRINSVLAKLQSTNASVDIVIKLASVVAKFPLSNASQLVQAGYEEHEGIGYRMMETYRNLFDNVQLNELSFTATSVQRTVDSCMGFQEGFFAQHGRNVTASISQRDDLLRFYDNCDAYNKMESKPSAHQEYNTFQIATFPNIIKQYLEAGGFTLVDITLDELASIYQVGAIEYASQGTTHWSEFISPENLLKLEYSADLESYYKLGYAYPINYEQSCPLISQLFHDMDKVINGSQYKKGLFYFAHAETVVPLLDILGLFNDLHRLTASNFAQQDDRSYKTGHISPFAANVGFVQYSCDVDAIEKNSSVIPEGIFPAKPVRNMTLLLFREAPMQFPSCPALMCPYATVREHYSGPVDHCDFDATCALGVSAAASAQSTYAAFILTAFILITFCLRQP